MIYISFDKFYSNKEYNKFVLGAFNNGIKFTEFISIRPPYYWWVRIKESDLPNFLDYEKTHDTRYLCSKIIPRYSSEEFNLSRKDNTPKQEFKSFIENDVLKIARKQDFICVFFFQGLRIKDYSEKINSKVWVLGLKGDYRIGICFDSNILKYIDKSNIILIEDSGDYRQVGELEARINYVWKPDLKLTHKTMESSYFLKGEYKMIDYPIIKIS